MHCSNLFTANPVFLIWSKSVIEFISYLLLSFFNQGWHILSGLVTQYNVTAWRGFFFLGTLDSWFSERTGSVVRNWEFLVSMCARVWFFKIYCSAMHANLFRLLLQFQCLTWDIIILGTRMYCMIFPLIPVTGIPSLSKVLVLHMCTCKNPVIKLFEWINGHKKVSPAI